MNSRMRSLLLALVCLVSFTPGAVLANWQCPTFDGDALMETLMVCVQDPDGLCGSTCVGALVSGALSVADEIPIPCEGGISGVLENVFKRCTEENGGTFDPCDGAVEQQLQDNAQSVRCVEGGYLSDYL